MTEKELQDNALQYLQNIVVPDYIPTDEDKLRKMLFMASEEIGDIYPQIKQSPRMVVLQMLYQAEAEDEGFGVLKRHDVQDYTVKDVKVVFKHGRLSPQVQSMIDDILEEVQGPSTGRVGWFI